ncbi:MAG: acetyl-CoA carboxylase biotin carboxyl carrier protein subunit [Candidatus Symbiothrix sp.]|jgi:biotin carboxyl carrier protein|nr:acetyl-CoA carboxylase biotin carboxyl carrier protein subunit [Candidatus Symbiothrix sp.]
MKSFKYTINGNVYKVVINRIEDTVADVEVNGTPYKVEMNRPAKKQVVTINRPAQTTMPPLISRPHTSSGAGALRSPLPGIILEILCKAGDPVKKGQKVLVLEAMKMENVINADRDGVIKEVKINKGDSVLEGADLIIIE